MFSLIEQKGPIKNGKEFYTVAKIVHKTEAVHKIISFRSGMEEIFQWMMGESVKEKADGNWEVEIYKFMDVPLITILLLARFQN